MLYVIVCLCCYFLSAFTSAILWFVCILASKCFRSCMSVPSHFVSCLCTALSAAVPAKWYSNLQNGTELLVYVHHDASTWHGTCATDMEGRCECFEYVVMNSRKAVVLQLRKFEEANSLSVSINSILRHFIRNVRRVVQDYICERWMAKTGRT